MDDAHIQKEDENCIQESCYDSYDQWCGNHQTNIFLSYGKCAVKEREEFQDDGLQIHGHTYEDKYEILQFLFHIWRISSWLRCIWLVIGPMIGCMICSMYIDMYKACSVVPMWNKCMWAHICLGQ